MDWVEGAIGGYLGSNPLTSGIYSGIKNAEAAEKQDNLVADRSNRLDNWYNEAMGRDFLDSNVASSVFNKSLEQLKDANKKTENKGAITGATNEAELASKTANQKNFSNSMSSIASMGTAYKDRIEGRYQSQMNDVFKSKMGLLERDIESAQNTGANSDQLMETATTLLPLLI